MRKAATTCILVMALAAAQAWGATIVDSRPSGGGVVVGGYSWNTWAQTFTIPVNLTDVTVDVFLQKPDDLTISREGWEDTRVWLTTQAGPGTTSAHVVAYTTLAPGATPPTDPIFTLPALAAGNYAIVVAPSRYLWPAPPSPTGWWWMIGAPVGSVNVGNFAVHALATSSTSRFVDRNFPPASNFQTGALGTTNTLALRVSGVPEPATLALLALGAAGALLRRKRA